MAAVAAAAASPASPAQGSSAVGGQAWAQAVGECPLEREDFDEQQRAGTRIFTTTTSSTTAGAPQQQAEGAGSQAG